MIFYFLFFCENQSPQFAFATIHIIKMLCSTINISTPLKKLYC